MEPELSEAERKIRLRIKETPEMRRDAARWHRNWCKRHFNRGDIIEIKKETGLWNEQEIDLEGPVVKESDLRCEEECQPERRKKIKGINYIAPRANRVDRKLRKNMAKGIYGYKDVILTPRRHYMEKIEGEDMFSRANRIIEEHSAHGRRAKKEEREDDSSESEYEENE